VFTYPLVLYMVFVLPEHFTIYVDCGVNRKPTPSHVRVLVSYTHYVQEVRGHMEARECSWLGLLYCGDNNHEILGQYVFPIE
jgi:hypothetical protein